MSNSVDLQVAMPINSTPQIITDDEGNSSALAIGKDYVVVKQDGRIRLENTSADNPGYWDVNVNEGGQFMLEFRNDPNQPPVTSPLGVSTDGEVVITHDLILRGIKDIGALAPGYAPLAINLETKEIVCYAP